jgi:hypothetical protein
MKAVCIMDIRFSNLLTVGKTYEIVSSFEFKDELWCKYIDNFGLLSRAKQHRFKPLSELRKEKLQKLSKV